MTLKSNKNEPAVILESVCSVRTALSDLYLEQLLQNKPKSDKVRSRFFIVCLVFFLPFFFHRWWCLVDYMFASGKQRRGPHDWGFGPPPPRQDLLRIDLDVLT